MDKEMVESFKVGRQYFIRTVTMNYTGKLVLMNDKELVLKDCAWIADTGTRLSEFLSGQFNASTEIEPFANPVIISRGAIVDATVWSPALPREKR